MADFTKDELENLNGITSSRHGFIFHFTVMELFEDMSYSERGQVLEAIFYYVGKGEDIYPPLKKGTLGYLTLKQFKSLYSKDASKWLKKSQTNKENGKKGGSAPRNNHDPITGEIKDPNKHPIYG